MTLDVKIVVFVDVPNTTEQAYQIKIFNNLGYCTLVDSLHKRDYSYLFENTMNGRMFIQEEDEVYMFDRNDLRQEMYLVPDFALIFGEDKEVTEADWSKIYKYLEQHLTDSMLDVNNAIEVEGFMGKPLLEIAEPENDVAVSYRGDDFYSLETRYLEEDDIMLYEVKKPFTDLPYTSITRNYSNKGHTPFFTDLFICNSWGVARSDVAFLKHTWGQFKMEGEFDLEELMKKATEKCLPSETNIPEPEPEVYRRDLLTVLDIIKEKKSRNQKIIPDYIKNKTNLA